MTTIDYKQKIKDYMNSSEIDTLYKSMLINLFPELKESEDEKVEKAIFGMVYDSDNELWSSYDVSKSDVLAWLEKQGEQKPANNQFTPEEANVLNEHIDKFLEQKPAWSKEDETYLNTIVSDLDYSKAIHNKAKCNFIDKEIKWLKSLKDRVQPKQEWSEEDKGNLLDVKCIIYEVWNNQHVRTEIDHSCEELESLWHWLDNIWQRVEYPQDKWKPSDKQLKSLR